MQLIGYNVRHNEVITVSGSQELLTSIIKNILEIQEETCAYDSIMFCNDIDIESALQIALQPSTEIISIGGNLCVITNEDMDAESEFSSVIGLPNRASIQESFIELSIENFNETLEILKACCMI